MTPVRPGGEATEIPMVVLVNQGTASAAEIVTGALQDASRAKVIGETTFGTGTVLNGFPLPDQSELLLATEEWLTPKGRVIWHHGLVPDTQVQLAADVALLTPQVERGLTPEKIQTSGDTQVLAALKALGQPVAEILSQP
jgi:carboxyl-terminal processing protease